MGSQGGAGEIAYIVSVWAIPAIIAITFHEAAHGFVAWRLGDDTAYRMGRVTFNPFRHIDPFGTILLPALLLLSGTRFLFGWAKPVPVNFGRLNRPRRDMILVAAAGPVTNLLLAIASGFLIHVAELFPVMIAGWAIVNLQNSIIINTVLAVFNMLPLPPLDGGRVAVGLLPRPLARPLARLERYGMLLIIAFVFILPLLGREIGVNLNIFSWLVGAPVRYLIDSIAMLTGIQ
jgi:Zn-dependent protease